MNQIIAILIIFFNTLLLFGQSNDLINQFDRQWEITPGVFRVMKDGKIGIVTLNKTILPCEYQQIWDLDESGYFRIMMDGKVGVCHLTKGIIIPTEYDQIWEYENDRVRVLKDGFIGYVDTVGSIIIPPIFTQIWDFEGDSAKAVFEGDIVYINKKGGGLSILYKEESVDGIKGKDIIEKKESKSVIAESVSEKNDSTMLITIEKKKKYKRFKGHFSGIDIGYNGYLNSKGSSVLPGDYYYLSLNSSKSIEFNANICQEGIRLSSSGNFGLVTGLGINFNNYRYDKQDILHVDSVGNISFFIAGDLVLKSKLTTLYLNIPFLLEFQIKDHSGDPFYINGGVIGGIRISSHTKVVYNNEGDKLKKKSWGDFNLNRFRYGFMARTGYKFVNLYGVYYMTSLFNGKTDPELYPYSVGISFYPDWN